MGDILGLPGLSENDQKKVQIGNQLAEVTIEIISRLLPEQLWSIENPAGSFFVAITRLPEAGKATRISKSGFPYVRIWP